MKSLIRRGKFENCSLDTQQELFEYLAKCLVEEKYVHDEFLEAIVFRESRFPTGLLNANYNIALPHVESKYVRKNALIICVLDKPIIFHRMDVIDEEILVKVVFMLLIKDLELHTTAIADLTKIWFNEQIMNGILKIKNKEQLLHLINGNLIINRKEDDGIKTVLIACGSGIATSTIIGSKISEILDKEGVEYKIIQCSIPEIERYEHSVDVIVGSTPFPREYEKPTLMGMSFITGINEEAVTRELLNILHIT